MERETGVKVAFIPGEEFAATTVNVTVNFPGEPADLAGEIRETLQREVQAYRRRNGGGSPFPLAR